MSGKVHILHAVHLRKADSRRATPARDWVNILLIKAKKMPEFLRALKKECVLALEIEKVEDFFLFFCGFSCFSLILSNFGFEATTDVTRR